MKTIASAAVIIVLTLVVSASTALAYVAGGGDMQFKPPNAKPVVFSHEEHVSVKELRCSACHNHTFQMSREDDNKMDMKKMTKNLFCGRCHNGSKAFDVKDRNNCGRCHK
jgi:c(7)-type cytochrome triheme protein